MVVQNKDLTILIVDDEPDILELLEEEFRYTGFKTVTAACGNDAIKILGEHKIDIIVSDYRMPNGNGMSVLEHAKKMLNPPLFYFVSGQADVTIEEALKAGAKKFFSKPFDFDTLIKEIEGTVLA